MYMWILKKVGWKFAAAGATAAIAGTPLVRPAVVGLAKFSLTTKDFVLDSLNSAKAEVSSILAEADGLRHATATGPASSDLAVEISSLRAEVASLSARKPAKPAVRTRTVATKTVPAKAAKAVKRAKA